MVKVVAWAVVLQAMDAVFNTNAPALVTIFKHYVPPGEDQVRILSESECVCERVADLTDLLPDSLWCLQCRD